MAKRSARKQGKSMGKGKRKPSKLGDLPVASRKARSVKGGAFTATTGGTVSSPSYRSTYTIT